jgi:ankyrin repeat protein
MWSVEKGREVVIRKCYESGVYSEAVDEDGWTAMMYATRRGNVSIINVMLEFGASLNHATKEEKFTALHLAAGNELIDVCLALIKAGANPDMKDAEGMKAVDYLKDPKNKEKLRDCMLNTYKEGKTADQIHRHRVEAGQEKSVSFQRIHSGKYSSGGALEGDSHLEDPEDE